MLRLFKTHQIYPVAPIILLSGLLWFFSWGTHFRIMEPNGMPLYDLIFNILQAGSVRAYAVVGFLLFTSQAIHLNYIISKHEILYKTTWLPALMYLLVGSLFPAFLSFHPLLFINSILLIALDKIFSLYKSPSALSLAFDSAFLLGLAALFYAPGLVLFVFFAIGIILLRPFSWRDWFVGILGFVLPFFFAFLYYFLNDSIELYYNRLLIAGIDKSISINRLYITEYTFSVVLIAILFVLSVVRLQSNYYKNVTKSRLIQQLLLMCLLVGIGTILVSPDRQLYRFFIMTMPIAVYLAYFFISGKKNWIAEVVFLLCLGAWVYNYFFVSV